MRVGAHVVCWAEPTNRDEEGQGNKDDLKAVVEAVSSKPFARLGTGDVQGEHLELFVGLTAIGLWTDCCSIQIGAQVAQPTTRDVGAMAAGIRSLGELTGDRLFWVLGRGDGAARNAGRPPMAVEEFGRYFEAVRRLIVEQSTNYDGRNIRVPWPNQRGQLVPLYMVAEGPRMLEMAGQIADGVYVGTGLTADVVSNSLEWIEKGARSAGRSLDDVDIWWVARSAVSTEFTTALEMVEEDLSSAGNHALRGDFAAKRVPGDLHSGLAEYHSTYDYSAKASSFRSGQNPRLMHSLGLTDYFMERFGIVGTPEQVNTRLIELNARGIDQVIMRVRSVEEAAMIGSLPALTQAAS